MHYINSHFNEAIVTDDEDSDEDDDAGDDVFDDSGKGESISPSLREGVEGKSSTGAGSSAPNAVENLRAVLQDTHSSLEKYEQARQIAQASIDQRLKQAQ